MLKRQTVPDIKNQKILDFVNFKQQREQEKTEAEAVFQQDVEKYGKEKVLIKQSLIGYIDTLTSEKTTPKNYYLQLKLFLVESCTMLKGNPSNTCSSIISIRFLP